MQTGTIVVIVAAVAVVVGGAAVIAWLAVLPALRTRRLRDRFGPEYERAVEAHGSTAGAEHDLADRLRQRRGRRLRTPSEEERSDYARAWARVQRGFVDDPVGAVRGARGLTDTIMRDLGYPDAPAAPDGADHDDASFERRARDLSVDHPEAVARYRAARAAGHLAEADRTATENLREALIAYRGLVEALLGTDEPRPARVE
ncbi:MULTISPECIES: hypothetical protein [unclassified Nocardiopsis]|uniref:hypothetical protein n=1 Tax=unclassified Nocardiopsis TaxID=2649073 RepID=UPI0033C0F2B9